MKDGCVGMDVGEGCEGYHIFSNRSPPPVEGPASFWTPLSRSLFTFLSITWLKMV